MRTIRNFIRAFIRNDGEKPPKHAGYDLAKNVRDATGRVGGSGAMGASSAGAGGSTEAVLKQAAKGKQRK